MGLAEREYMKRTPAELNREYGVSRHTPIGGASSDARVWIVGVFVATIAADQLAAWMHLGFAIGLIP